jgi:hypothetical protein
LRKNAHMHTNPAPAVGQQVRFDSPSGWGHGTIVDVASHRQITGHDGNQVTWADSTTHVDVTVEWADGHENFGTAPGERTTVAVGHSMGGNPWPATWKVS